MSIDSFYEENILFDEKTSLMRRHRHELGDELGEVSLYEIHDSGKELKAFVYCLLIRKTKTISRLAMFDKVVVGYKQVDLKF